MSHWLRGLACACICFAVSCSGSRQDSLDSSQAPGPGSGLSAGLPSLDRLPEAKRSVSEAAPGFYELDPLETIASANTVDGGGFLSMDNNVGVPTYAVYGVYGFDGDNYPVSVKLDCGAGGGEFYVAFSDYALGNWAISGPFNASGEFGIPLLEEHSSTSAFTSPSHTHYFAVIVPNGNVVELGQVELGVSGGVNAPEPVFIIQGNGGANGLYLFWSHSYSYQDPDFAGYVVERAPQFGGSFSPLSAQPGREAFFEDSTAVIDTEYRYRVVTLDTSGNSATSPTVVLGPTSGEEAKPIALVDLPRGPLNGPVDIFVDMSDSFDPEGEGITTYTIGYLGPQGSYQTLGPQATLTLQPGCYAIFCQVECADGRDNSTIRLLKVYPQWQETSTLVRATEPTGNWKRARLAAVHGGKLPADGRLTLAGYDGSMPGLAFYHYNGSGFDIARCPQIEYITDIGEPLTIDESLVFPVVSDSDFFTAAYDGSQVVLQAISPVGDSYAASLCKDSNNVPWYVYVRESGLQHKLYYDGDLVGQTSYEGEIVTGAISNLDTVMDPATGMLISFCESGPDLIAASWDPATQLPGGTAVIGTGLVYSVDAEINPATNRIVVLYNIDGTASTREQDGLGGWLPKVDVDNSMLNSGANDLLVSADGQLNTYFALANGQGHRYIYNAGVWNDVNTASYSADSGYQVCVLPIASSPDVSVVDLCSDGEIRIARFNDDGTDNVFATISSVLGQGFDMHAAAGNDGLHVIWMPRQSISDIQHVVSDNGPDQGSVWADKDTYAADFGLNLKATSMGEVYATGYTGGAATLYYWDPGTDTFMNDQFYLTSGTFRPMLGTLYNNDDILFGGWDNVGNTFHLISGKHGAYNADAPYVPALNPVYDAAIAGSPIGTPFIVMQAGPNLDQPAIGRSTPPNPDFDLYFQPLLDGSVSPYDKPSVIGHTMDVVPYFSGFNEFDQVSMVSVFAQGSFINPLRTDTSFFGTMTNTELELNEFSQTFEPRYTVSLCDATGLTAVNLVSSLDGTRSHFEWSNFGNWEELQLPAGLENMSCPLLAVGIDGRWHLIYKDWVTDSIMCRSTL